ncbi:MAG: TolC family protein [Candidatus Hydrogenedentota bacterium]
MKLRVMFMLVCTVGLTVQTWSDSHETSAPLPSVLSLEEAQRIALSENPTLKAARDRVDQAAAILQQAMSEYLPSVTSSVTASFTDISDNDVVQGQALAMFSGGSFDDTIENYDANITASYLLFDGFGRKFRRVLASLGTDRSEATRRETQRLLLNAVALSYYNVQLSRENVRIAEADEAFNERQLNEAKARFDVGQGSLSDKLNFEVRIRAAQTAVLVADSGHDVAMIALVQLMGVTRDRVSEDTDVAPLKMETDADLTLPDVNEGIAYSLVHRPDWLETQYIHEQTEASVKLAKSTYFPSLFASASGDARRGDNAYFEEDDISGTVAIQGQYSIYLGGRRRAQLHESKAVERELSHVLESQEIQITAEVLDAVRRLETAQRVLELQRETTSLVEQNRDLVEKEYNAGQGSLVRLNQAQRDLISQQASLALARVSLHQNWVDLRTATAVILEDVK